MFMVCLGMGTAGSKLEYQYQYMHPACTSTIVPSQDHYTGWCAAALRLFLATQEQRKTARAELARLQLSFALTNRPC